MEENYILNVDNSGFDGENKRKLGKKEKKELEKKKIEKEKRKEKEMKKKKEVINKREKNRKKEEKLEFEKNREEKKKTIKEKISKIFIKKRKNQEEDSEENSKINILDTLKDGLGLINHDKIIAQKSKKTKLVKNDNFDNTILKAFEKLTSLNEKKNKKEKNKITKNSGNVKSCERKLRSALNILEKDKNIIINRNILDILNKIIDLDKINLNYIIGNIYSILMKRGNIFNFNEDFEYKDFTSFLNKAIHLRDTLINTKNGIYYKNNLIKYLRSIINKYEFEEDQLNLMEKVLKENKEIKYNIKLKLQNDLVDIVDSTSDNLIKQKNLYEQYNVLIQNKRLIMDNIQKVNLKNKENYNNYLEFGRILSYLFFNKLFRLYISENNKEEEDDSDNFGIDKRELFGFFMIFYDNHKSNSELNIINSENYLIDNNEEIEELKGQLCDIIIAYAKKFISLTNNFSVQYIIYILIKRIFFSNYEKYKNASKNLLIKALSNLCFFENSIEIISYFINKILKSKDEQFKEELMKELNKAKENENFLYIFPEERKIKQKEEENNNEEEEKSQQESEYEDDYDEEDANEEIEIYNKINSEILFLLEKDFKIGFFNVQNIKKGEKFIFYEEIRNSFGILDFCMYIKELDIKLTITDITEGKQIFHKDRIDQLIDCPFKLILFFTNPRILKFEIDNSYSWFTSKTIKYKTNILYPENPFLMGNKIAMINYKKSILNGVKLRKRKENKENIKMKNDVDNLLIIKINGENRVFNCENVKSNLNEIHHMIKNKDLNIFSIYIEINLENNNLSNFYYFNEEKTFIKNELNQEAFEKYLFSLINKSNSDMNIINLYILNDDLNTMKNGYNNCNLKKILGFEPLVTIDDTIQKILFFIQELNQAQILFYLYKQNLESKKSNKIIFMNYSEYFGYKILLYNNGEILYPIGINRQKNLEENIDIIINNIKSIYEEDKIINVLLNEFFDEKKNEITTKKIEDILNKKLENDSIKNFIKIEKLDIEFNRDLEINSHIFYLDN